MRSGYVRVLWCVFDFSWSSYENCAEAGVGPAGVQAGVGPAYFGQAEVGPGRVATAVVDTVVSVLVVEVVVGGGGSSSDSGRFWYWFRFRIRSVWGYIEL